MTSEASKPTKKCVCGEINTRHCPVHGQDFGCPACHRSIWDHAPDCKFLEPVPEC